MKFGAVILFLVSLPSFAQPAGDPEEGLLLWNEFYNLQWDDFEGTPDNDARGDAGTAVKIKATPFLVRKEIRYDVVALFNRKRSWARDRSPSLLAHERLHFDIAELYARKIRKKIAELRAAGVNEVSRYNEEINTLLAESNEFDRRYDIETLHGGISRKQAAWESAVHAGLKKLDHFRKQRRIIRRDR